MALGVQNRLDNASALAIPLASYESAEELIERPFADPRRKAARIDLVKAWRHLQKFKKDKEKTSELFQVFEALPWLGCAEAARQFLGTAHGQEIYRREPFLPDILDDHQTLRRHPRESFAQAYCDFMERENLTAHGLVAEYEDARQGLPRLDDKIGWYIDRQRDTHDFLHILTGIGRDVLGEACLGAFVFARRPSPGHLLSAYAAGLMITRRVRVAAPIFGAINEARLAGRHCSRLFEQPILELLPMPLAEVRSKLNIRHTHQYFSVLQTWRSAGLEAADVVLHE